MSTSTGPGSTTYHAAIQELSGRGTTPPNPAAPSTPQSYVDEANTTTPASSGSVTSNPLHLARKAKERGEGIALLADKYNLHVFSSRNNTRATFTRGDGKIIRWATGGSCGFKGVNRSSYEAGYQVAVRMFKAIAEEREALEGIRGMQIELIFKGFGQGRDAMSKALLTAEGTPAREVIGRITDRTPIKIGGTRAKKMRRL
ncbi:translational machinery component [Gloeophyllum trabeum ATCC 11539]|uniref:Translational machinery component n=1 Tax=Gloeophyllum trabeum (strain ATCC 11539 / FP-39264 / Madison 617) TaxID=670483 RepID=S7QJ08_GLOTA|nr:translational machinery component [Gloeophyllum trabeum ATCC 11539]EPQ59631.1 translational machinery component [Gloeophyllum trabeum ATCC 11539]